MTLFNTNTDKPVKKTPPKRHKYSVGFLKVYDAFNKFTNKREASDEFHKKCLEGHADYIAEKALRFHLYCKKHNRIQMDLRRWLHNDGWEDELFQEELAFRTPKEAHHAFMQKKWTHCGPIDCRQLRVKWNEECLILGDQKLIPSNKIRETVFLLRFDGLDVSKDFGDDRAE